MRDGCEYKAAEDDDMPKKTTKQIIRAVTVELFGDSVGCLDHSCIFGHPGGLGTNGGCGCLKDNKTQLAITLQRLAQVCRALAERV